MSIKQSSLHYICVPVLDMRKEPDDNAEIVSQSLFSEPIEIIENSTTSSEWIEIKTLADRYRGWVKNDGICQRDIPYPLLPSEQTVTINRLSAHVYDVKDTIYGPRLTLPFGICMDIVDDTDIRWIKVVLPDKSMAYIQKGDVFVGHGNRLNRIEMCEFSFMFLGLPYTWGGRSSFGFDCSGFIQMLYRQMGVFLPRDSQQQFSWNGLIETPIANLSPGDLVFYGYSPDKIRHVGLYLGNEKFIHTAAVTENLPHVRISAISDPAWNGSGYYPYFSGKKLSR